MDNAGKVPIIKLAYNANSRAQWVRKYIVKESFLVWKYIEAQEKKKNPQSCQIIIYNFAVI